MAEDRSHDIETDAERSRLSALVARLSDADLSRAMPGGWTVAGILAHAAYWDARAIYWLDRWAGGTAPSPYVHETALSDAMLAKIRATGGPPFNLSRAIHRKEHLDDIEHIF